MHPRCPPDRFRNHLDRTRIPPMPNLRSLRVLAVPAACGVFTCGLAASALAQLRESQVLVVYDSRIPDSRALAEFYAGSAKVPGGVGSIAGVHPRVRALDISTRVNTVNTAIPAGVFPQQADIDYATFKSAFRDPLRAYLAQQNLSNKIRCILLTKGIPHRIQNISNTPPLATNIGDNPAGLNAAFNAGVSGDFTYCSMDSELSLLQQPLDAGEAGAQADSRADGMIVNPYFRSPYTINAYTTRNILTTKLFGAPGGGFAGFFWLNSSGTAPTNLTPGDIYLVCRIDGNTLADAQAIITRAQNVAFPMATARLLFDSDGSAIDGSGNPMPLDVGPDYSLSRTLLLADGRFPTANIISDTAGGFTGFFIGPNLSYPSATNGPPLVLADPLLLLASFGSNHSGVNGNGSNAGTTYAQSFNYLPGAVFNTIESYNGRSFGGIGGNPFVPQQQAADALAAGATFAVGNAWEPFALSVADNEQLCRNFFLGNMTWAEAAYTALPALSWQQVVIGDPLARPRRDREDINASSRVTIDDLYAWQQAPVDLNNSTVADTADFLLLESTVRGFEAAGMKGDQRP